MKNTHCDGMKPMTIQIYLPFGDPQGLRMAEMRTRAVQVFEVPRTEIGRFLEMPESDQVAVYYLLGDETEDRRISCYIGRPDATRQRFGDHLKRKDFWSRTLIVVSHPNTRTPTRYLEWQSIRKANKAGRFAIENGNAGSRPDTIDLFQAEGEDIFDTIEILLATLGCPLFQKGVATVPQASSMRQAGTAQGARF
jgi:hypothetical protein